MARTRALGAALSASAIAVVIACRSGSGDTATPASHSMRSARAPTAAAVAADGGGLDGGDLDAGASPAESYEWVKLPSANPPSPRDGFGMAYDVARGQTVLFGGESCNNESFYCADPGTFGETWTWDGTAWQNRSGGTSPPERFWDDLVFDSARNVTLLFGGQYPAELPDGGSGDYFDLGDTWEWNGTTWSEVALSGPGPAARDQFGMAYDSKRQVVVLFGGEQCESDDAGLADCTTNGSAPLADTWEWNGTSWKDVTPSDPTLSPPARLAHKMVYDAARGVTLMFGGISCYSVTEVLCPSASVEYGDTWEWDGTSWTNVTPDDAGVSPSARDSFAMTFDPRRGRVVLFGGYGASNDTWEWDGASWAPVTPSSVSPSYRFWSRLVFDESAGRCLMFGGTTDSTELNDTWQFYARGESCTQASNCDTGNCTDGACCETASCGTCESCNTAASPGVCAPIYDTPDPPSCSGTQTCDGRGQCKLVVGESCPNGNSDCANGACVDGFCCNDTCASPCEVCAAALGATADGTCSPAKRGYSGNPPCTDGFVCDGTSTTCPTTAAPIVCDGDHTVTNADQSQTDCSPYTCDVSGCRSICSDVEECVYPAVCNESQQCIVPADAIAAGVSGCSLGAPGARGRAGRNESTGLVLLVVVGAWARRRRSVTLRREHPIRTL